jgi:hypothetical protein
VNWERHAKALRAALKAKEEFLVCYRTGKDPSEALWRRLARARDVVAAFDEEVGGNDQTAHQG